MSWQATAWADSLPYDAMKPLATRVLFKLANVAAQDGKRAFRSKWDMADELGVDQRSVQRALRELEQAGFIGRGDQRAVAHLRGDRRPTVYDLNFQWRRDWSAPPLPLPQPSDEAPDEPIESGPIDGETQLSTGCHGETNGETPTVPLRTKGTNSYVDNSYVPDRPRHVWMDARCPANWREGVHEFNERTRKCANCFEPPLSSTKETRS